MVSSKMQLRSQLEACVRFFICLPLSVFSRARILNTALKVFLIEKQNRQYYRINQSD